LHSAAPGFEARPLKSVALSRTSSKSATPKGALGSK